MSGRAFWGIALLLVILNLTALADLLTGFSAGATPRANAGKGSAPPVTGQAPAREPLSREAAPHPVPTPAPVTAAAHSDESNAEQASGPAADRPSPAITAMSRLLWDGGLVLDRDTSVAPSPFDRGFQSRIVVSPGGRQFRIPISY